MKVYNPQTNTNLNPELCRLLSYFRNIRSFSLKWIDLKCITLNTYMSRYGLKSCIIALSGGIDSSLVTALIHRASKIPGSPIKKIVPVMMPCVVQGSSNQSYATNRGIELINQLDLDPFVMDISEIHKAYKSCVDQIIDIQGDTWASGQLI